MSLREVLSVLHSAIVQCNKVIEFWDSDGKLRLLHSAILAGVYCFLVDVSVFLSVCLFVRIFMSSLAFELLHNQTLYFLRSSSVQKSRRGLYVGSGEALLTEF